MNRETTEEMAYEQERDGSERKRGIERGKCAHKRYPEGREANELKRVRNK